MGDVFLAKVHRPSGDPEVVALKRLRRELWDDPQAQRQFEREARICSLLRHPNIVLLREFGRDDDGPYLALEYVNGCSAATLQRSLAARAEPLPLRAAFSICRDIAAALRYAHTYRDADQSIDGVIHRDVTPENVLVGFGGSAKLADFGIARMIGGVTTTQTTTVKGKFPYMAPELFGGHAADRCTDLFALGATAFTIIAGFAPFQGRTEAELINAVLHATPPRISSVRPGVPAAIETWIAHAMEKGREQRPLDSLDLSLALDAFCGGEAGRNLVSRCMRVAFPEGTIGVAEGPGAPVPPSTKSAQWRAPRARTRQRTAMALGAAAIVLGTAVGVWRWRDHLRRAEALSDDGWLSVATSPGARVFVDGRLVGVAPLQPIRLPEGPHAVLVIDQKLSKSEAYQVQIHPRERQDLSASVE